MSKLKQPIVGYAIKGKDGKLLDFDREPDGTLALFCNKETFVVYFEKETAISDMDFFLGKSRKGKVVPIFGMVGE